MNKKEKNKGKNKKNLIFTILALCFSIVVATSTIFAWFSISNNTGVEGFTLNVRTNSIINATVNTYAISLTIGEQLQNNYALALNESNFIPLQQIPNFDFNNIALNDYRACLALNINFTLTQNEECVITARATNNLVTIGTENWLSNCILFYSANYNSNDSSLITYDTPETFVTLVQNQLNKIDNIEIYHNSVVAGNVSIWYVLEYNSDVLLKIHNDNTVLDDEYINYYNDIVLEISAL